MKIYLPYKWGCEDPRADLAITKKAERLITFIQEKRQPCMKQIVLTRYFQSYEDMYNQSYAKCAMRAKVAQAVFEYGCYIGGLQGITRDVVEGLWYQVFGREIWQFTGSYSPFSKG